jgi:hypothetical protein
MTIVINWGDQQTVIESSTVDDNQHPEISSDLHKKARIMKARLEAVFGSIDNIRREMEDSYSQRIKLHAECHKINAMKPMKLSWFSGMLGSIFTKS